MGVDTAIIAAAAALIGAVTFVAAEHYLHVGRYRAGGAAIAAACLAALIAGELTISEVRRWWAARPVTAATAVGLLVLALTVLVVQSVVERFLELRLKPAAESAVLTLIIATSQEMGVFQRRAMWPSTVRVDSFEGVTDDFYEDLARLVGVFRRTALGVAGVLTMTAGFQSVYDHALEASRTVEEIQTRAREWRDGGPAADLELPMWASEDARLSWWGLVALWEDVVVSMRELEGDAWSRLGFAWDEDYAWHAPWPRDFVEARRKYCKEFGELPLGGGSGPIGLRTRPYRDPGA